MLVRLAGGRSKLHADSEAARVISQVQATSKAATPQRATSRLIAKAKDPASELAVANGTTGDWQEF